MGNLTSTNKPTEDTNNIDKTNNQNEILSKINELLGGSDTENFSQNELNQQYLNKLQQLLQTTETNHLNAVSGNTENLFTENKNLSEN